MTEPSWAAIEAELRPFVRRRVGDDTDDVMQEVLMRLHRGLPALEDPDRLGPWMIAVARSAIADHGRRRARRRELPTDELTEIEDVSATKEEEADRAAANALAGALRYFVADLPPDYRDVLELTELQGLTQREAAERLDLSLTAVKSRVARGRRRLRRDLEACCDFALDGRNRVVDMSPKGGPAPCC